MNPITLSSEIDFNDFKGPTYEDTYSGWLHIFKYVAEASFGYKLVHNAPAEWRPLLWYLGEEHPEWAPHLRQSNREFIEASCAKAPVLVDALWRADMKWGGERRHTWEDKFSISTYSGFWRPEILTYLKKLHAFTPTKRKCVLVPCAADKPYPSPLHQVIREEIPEDYELIVVTSALGLVPESMWQHMPEYDSGLPYFERVREEVERYFSLHEYNAVISYTDMLEDDIAKGLSHLLSNLRYNGRIMFPMAHLAPRCDYQPLAAKSNLSLLRTAIQQAEEGLR